MAILLDRKKIFDVDHRTPKDPYYVLEMLPYPSGNLHMGHIRNYSLGDALSRFARSQGKEVLYVMAWDAFGMPAENAAMQNKTNPQQWTQNNIAQMRQAIKKLGFSYDWRREIATCEPTYYAFEQEMFLSFLEKGIAYKKTSWVNWDPVDQLFWLMNRLSKGGDGVPMRL